MSKHEGVVVVTGASGGIGAAICQALEARGTAVARLDVAAPPDGSPWIECDVRSPGAWQRAVESIRADHGAIRAAFLNAGLMLRGRSEPIDDDPLDYAGTDAYHRVFDVNLHGYVYGLQAIAPSIAARGGGHVVATASTAGLEALPFDPYYSMSKHAVIGFVRSFAATLEARGVRIHCLCPGGVQTAIVPDAMTSVAGAFMEPSEMASAAIALLESPATGDVWVKDEAGKPAWEAPVVKEPMGGPAFP